MKRIAAASTTGLVALAVASTVAPPAAANQQIDERAGTLEQWEEDAQQARSYGELVQLRVYSGSDFTIGSDFDEFDATTYEPNGRVKVTLPVARNAALRLIGRGSAQLTDFDDVSTTLFGTPETSDPYGNLYRTSFQLQLGVRPDWSGLFSDEERWSLLGEGRVGARWEAGASFGRAITGGGAIGVGYQIGDWLEILVGAGVSTRILKSGVSIVPVFEADWRFAERWRLRTRGQGVQLEYDIDDDLTVFTGAQRRSRSYLTEDRSWLGGEGRLKQRSLPVTLGVRWDVSETVELTFVGGAVLKQELRAQNEHRDDVGHVRAGPTPFLGITVELRPGHRSRGGGGAAAQSPAGSAPSSGSISTSR